MSDGAVARFVADFDAAQAALPGAGHDWVAALRRDGLARFRTLGLPGPRDEAWKYTRLNVLEKHAFQSADATAAVPDIAALQLAAPVHRLVFVNGRFRAELSELGALPAGVRLGPLAAALDGDTGALRGVFADSIADADAFTALNTAYMDDGVLLELADNVVLEAPVQLLFVSTSGDDYVSHPRNVIVAGAHSQATLLEVYAGPAGGGYFTNARTELRLAAGARIEHVRVQDESRNAFHIGSLTADVGRDAGYRSQVFSFGAQLNRLDIDVRLAQGAECDLDGLYVGGKRQHIDHQTRVDHAEPHARSGEFYKGVLDGAARAVFTGKVLVRPDVQKTDAKQMNRNLLLSPRAEIDSRPQLEIYADDVKCAHGATVGQLSETELFYLRSRGIDESDARQLLIHAFANELVDRVRDPALRVAVYRHLDACLPGRDSLGEMA